MVKETYTQEHTIEYYDVDKHKRLKLQNLLDIVNNASFLQSEELGCGLEYLASQDLTWVFYKMELVIKRAPTFKEKISVRTYALGSRRYYASRKFEVFDENGNEIAYAYGLYFLIDIEKRKPAKIPDTLMKCYGESFASDVVCLRDLKLKPIKEAKMERSYRVRFSDIDTNGHVNNAVYPLWAIESLPIDIYEDHHLNKVEIIFEKEVFLDNDIKVATDYEKSVDTLEGSHTIYNEDNETVCHLKTYWDKI